MRVAPQPEGVNRVGTREYAVFLTRDVCARDVSGAAVHALPLSTPLRVTLLAIALVSGCEPSLEADLLSVDDVAPRRVEPGRTLAITGAGFPPGRAARVRLEGQLHLPGASPRPIVLLAEGRATAADAIEVRFDDVSMGAVEERGTFRGRVVVAFDGAEGRHEVVGRSGEQVLDLHPPEDGGVGAELARARRAARTIDALGLVLGEEPPRDPGLPIEMILAGSVAEQAGLIVGDRLLELDGVRLHRLSDAIPAPGDAEATLRVARRGEPIAFEVTLPLRETAEGPSSEVIAAAVVALTWLLALALLLAPSASAVDGVARRARATARAVLSRPRTLRAHRVGRWVLGAAFLAAWPVLARHGWLVMPLEALLLAAMALRVSAAWLATGGESFWRRALAATHALGTVLGLAVALGAAAAFGGTTDVANLAAQQQVWPWAWTALSTPIGTLALVLAIAAAGSAPSAISRGAGQIARWARGLDDIVLLAAAAATVAILAGGWHVGRSTGELTRALGGLTFVALAGALWLWLRRARALGRTRRGTLLGGAALTTLVAAATALRITGEPLPIFETAIARTFAAGAAALIVLALARWWSGRVPEQPEALHPFL